jgi:very-short-patch-repair endonuclease
MERRFKTTDRIRGTTAEIEEAARRLRRNMTPAEQRLWEALKGRHLAGLKFRRQHPVGPFVLDFYCPERKLVVELDGAIHDNQVNGDHARTEQLAGYGYRVIRLGNEEVFHDLDSVVRRILRSAEEA